MLLYKIFRDIDNSRHLVEWDGWSYREIARSYDIWREEDLLKSLDGNGEYGQAWAQEEARGWTVIGCRAGNVECLLTDMAEDDARRLADKINAG